MKKNDIINLIFFIVVLALSAYLYFNRDITISKKKFALDTLIEIKLTSSQNNLEEIIENGFEIIEYYERKLSYFNKNSFVWKLNTASKDSIKIDKDIYKLLDISTKLFHQTNSLYDVSIGKLTDIWNDTETIPEESRIENAIELVDFSQIDYNNHFIRKPVEMKLNFGSLAKGFILDSLSNYFIKHDIKSGIINAGGDIKIFGQQKAIRIGIQHPRAKMGEIIATLKIKNKSVVTSGDYERYVEIDSLQYHHILNPKTGYPARKSISVTVIAENALTADAYSTAIFLSGPEKGIKLANSIETLEVIIFYLDNKKIKYKKSDEMDKYLEKMEGV